MRRCFWTAICWCRTFIATGCLDGYARLWGVVEVDVRIEAGDGGE